MSEETNAAAAAAEHAAKQETSVSFDNELNQALFDSSTKSEAAAEALWQLKRNHADFLVAYVGNEISARLAAGQKILDIVPIVFEQMAEEARADADRVSHMFQATWINENSKVKSAVRYAVDKRYKPFPDAPDQDPNMIGEMQNIGAGFRANMYEIRENLRIVVLDTLTKTGLLAPEMVPLVTKFDADAALGEIVKPHRKSNESALVDEDTQVEAQPSPPAQQEKFGRFDPRRLLRRRGNN